MSTTALDLNKRLSQSMGDFIEHPVTTNIANSTLIVSTHFNKYDQETDGTFKGSWVYITDKVNAGEDRKVQHYYTANATCDVFGANFAAEATNIATVRLHRYSFTDKQLAINASIREIYPALHKRVDDTNLIANNILPNSRFERWDVTTQPYKYSATSCAATANADSGWTRGAGKSVKLVASEALGYMEITSDNYPRLLDLMGKTITFKCWVKPGVKDDARITIWAKQADGTLQNLSSTTSCPAGEWTLLKLENQKLNDDLVLVKFKFIVVTSGNTAHFTGARVTGRKLYEYMLPEDFQDGAVMQAFVQGESYSDDGCDDLHPRNWSSIYGFSIIDDGTDRYIRFPKLYPNAAMIRLIGISPLSTVSAATDTIEIDGRKLDLLMAYAKYKLFQALEEPVSTEDTGGHESASAKAYGEYMRLLPSLRMPIPTGTMNIPTY